MAHNASKVKGSRRHVFIADGSDTKNSVRVPANFNGAYSERGTLSVVI